MRLLLVLGSALLVACAGGEDSDAVGPICEEIGETCHEPAEQGDPDAQECHDLGHDGDEAACAARQAECVSLCTPVEG